MNKLQSRVVQGCSRDAWLADFVFFVKRELRKLLFVIRDLKVLRDPWSIWIIFYHSILRDFEWLEPSIGYRICNMAPSLSPPWFCVLQTLFLCQSRLLTRVSYLPIFVIWENELFKSVIRDPPFFSIREQCQRPPAPAPAPAPYVTPSMGILQHCQIARKLNLIDSSGLLGCYIGNHQGKQNSVTPKICNFCIFF